MNKLILIGNGFDLAHGFKTSFEDLEKNDFFEKTCEIYRHFENKGEARKKIVPF